MVVLLPLHLLRYLFFTCSSSLGYAEECLGLHAGRLHQADLGDGKGPQDQEYLARQAYFPILGTCWQSLVGAIYRSYP